MRERYAEIWARAEPYWQTRHNEVHTPEAFDLACELLDAYPEADPDVVLPAVLLHDCGYMVVPEDDHLKGLAGSAAGWDPDITRRHEIEGARLAEEILDAAGWDDDRIAAIQEIIDGHDSRSEALSLEDRLMKDSDKLWRFTESAARLCHTWIDTTPQGFTDWVERELDGWFFTDAARTIARRELERTRAALA